MPGKLLVDGHCITPPTYTANLHRELDDAYARCERAHEFVSNGTRRLGNLIDRQAGSPQDDAGTHLGVRNWRQIYRDHIHRNAADDLGADTLN